ncbi:MAG: FHA domain-containing protein [Gammaproteobacteria bacterium]|nr:FHA domain-containing protein [Gammaproteobacteria bacterium]
MAELIQYANGVPGIKWPLDKTVVRIGRSENLNDIAVDDAYASKSHAQIEVVFNQDTSELEYYVRDLESTNHTFHNQSPIQHVKLSHNDTVMVGKSKFVVLIEGVREYVSAEQATVITAEKTKNAEESLAEVVEEITREFKHAEDEDDLDSTIFASESGRHKFSRRLNIY